MAVGSLALDGGVRGCCLRVSTAGTSVVGTLRALPDGAGDW